MTVEAGRSGRGPRVLMYSQDGYGLGHFRRSSIIAQAMIEREPGTRVIIVADSPAPPFAPVRGIDFVKLPTVVKGTHALWHTGSLDIAIDDALELRSNIIVEIYRRFHPDIVLVDHMPIGTLGELKPMLDEIERSPSRPRVFLGLRDVLDEPGAIQDAWTATGAYDYLPYYDAVLVYGCEHILDVDAAYGLRPGARRIVYCNYVSNPPDAQASVRAPSDHPPFVLMMGGGGHDAAPLARSFLDAFPTAGLGPDLTGVVITGPTMERSERATLASVARERGISVLTSLPETASWARDARALVTMGGYNSLAEALALEKRALVVPRSGPSREQRIRSGLFERRDLVNVLDPDDLSVPRLAVALRQLLAADDLPKRENIPALDGAQRAADELLEPSPRTPVSQHVGAANGSDAGPGGGPNHIDLTDIDMLPTAHLR